MEGLKLNLFANKFEVGERKSKGKNGSQKQDKKTGHYHQTEIVMLHI